jgi:hypothetical protein
MAEKLTQEKLITDDLEPFVVPEDWEPDTELGRKIWELKKQIPKELGDLWYQMWLARHRNSPGSDRNGYE